MSESSSPTNRRTSVNGRDDEPMDGVPTAAAGPLLAKDVAAPAALDSLDPLTRQLRQMYGAIADEPIPEAIATLLERLKS